MKPQVVTMHGPKGRRVTMAARAALQALLGDEVPPRHHLIEALHRLQDHFGALHTEHLAALAERMKISQAEVMEVATFYHHFHHLPAGAPVFTAEAGGRPPRLKVRVCQSTTCALSGAEPLLATLQERLPHLLGQHVVVEGVPCVGHCAQSPVAVVHQHTLAHATVDTVTNVAAHGPYTPAPVEPRPAHRLSGAMQAGAYELLRACHLGQHTPQSLMATLTASGLRGLGGAGFPTGRKWQLVSEQPAPRLMAVNIDEGEPGTFKDHHFLRLDPHRFLEGMLVAAWAVGAEAVYIYIRDEYPAARALLETALAELQATPPHGLPLPAMHVHRGAGSYVCGEESAMMASIEGGRGYPRLRPPFVAERGLFGRPTLSHNFETLYWVRDIVAMGGEAWAAQGRRGRAGLRTFSVSGRVARPGVVRAPAGITLRELIDEHCGGMAPGHELYAYLPGGASGGILPARLSDLPLDFDTLQPHGCFIGSAAVVVLSQQDRAVDAARQAMRFFEAESCGQCTPCRLGTVKMRHLIAAPNWDRAAIEALAQLMQDASICGLGQAAPQPVRSVLAYFAHELEGA